VRDVRQIAEGFDGPHCIAADHHIPTARKARTIKTTNRFSGLKSRAINAEQHTYNLTHNRHDAFICSKAYPTKAYNQARPRPGSSTTKRSDPHSIVEIDCILIRHTDAA
jgi:hypothetical protein